MEIVQAVKKLNKIPRERLNFPETADFVYNFETLRKRPTSVAHLTNFSFEFFYEIFTEDASQFLLSHGAKKVKNDQKLKSRVPFKVLP